MKKLCFFIFAFLLICGNGLCEQSIILDGRVRGYGFTDCNRDLSWYIPFSKAKQFNQGNQTVVDEVNAEFNQQCADYRCQRDNPQPYVEPTYDEVMSLYDSQVTTADETLSIVLDNSKKKNKVDILRAKIDTLQAKIQKIRDKIEEIKDIE